MSNPKKSISKVRAKFLCDRISQFTSGTEVQMHAVHSGSEENKAFSDFTPSGEFKMHISKGKPAAELFEVGKEYYIDIIDATPEVEAVKAETAVSAE